LHNGDSGNPADKPNRESHPSRWKRIVAYSKCYFECRRARKKQETAEDCAARRTANATVWIAGFTFVAIVVGTFQFVAMRGQQRVMQRQLDEMQVEQRPWISVKITGVASPLMKIGNKVQIFVHYHLENVGKLPATRVFFYAAIVPELAASDFGPAIKGACDNIIDRMNSDINNAGITLFPNQTAESNFGTDQTPISDFSDLGTPTPAPFVAVCTVYRFKGDGGIFHFTPAAYILTPPLPTIPNAAPIKGLDVTTVPGAGMAVEIHALAQGNLSPT